MFALCNQIIYNMSDTTRKGARSIKDIPATILQQLNNGEIPTANLVEWLAINQTLLLQNILKQTKRTEYEKPIADAIANLKKQTVVTLCEVIGNTLQAQIIANNDDAFFAILSNHNADMARCWACYCIGGDSKLNIKKMLESIQPFASDAHFGVREMAWLAVRPSIAKNLEASITIFTKWAMHKNENVRRFASESTRPRGVWCAHITSLKNNPSIALPILEILKNDPAKYVQDSVGNWLNDASKTAPEFVRDICADWQKESGTKNTDYIVKKAMRSLEK
jgi:3-methyladenine DNA glycosylase AlkC